jgi:membrane protein insertase Oxa1/YidC/SpoIIIJ
MLFSPLMEVFTSVIYQPFFNLLVGIYYLLGLIPRIPHDMGIAVIVFTVVFRILWLPISLSSDRKEDDKRAISEKIKEIRHQYQKDPPQRRLLEKQLMRSNSGLLIATFVNIGFQVLIALMLYRIFTKGLEGADFKLLYSFIHQPIHPFNLIFLAKYDLAHPSLVLNLIQTLLIFAFEVMSIVFSPFPATRKDLSTVFVLPIISFIFFSAMPAGKKLFVITTLSFSIGLTLVKRALYWYHSLNYKLNSWIEAKQTVDPLKKSGV